jgi:hypothetical protein
MGGLNGTPNFAQTRGIRVKKSAFPITLLTCLYTAIILLIHRIVVTSYFLVKGK